MVSECLENKSYELFVWYFEGMNSRDVKIHRELVENRFKYVTIQTGWEAKQVAIQLWITLGVYMNVLSLEQFRLCFHFILSLNNAY